MDVKGALEVRRKQTGSVRDRDSMRIAGGVEFRARALEITADRMFGKTQDHRTRPGSLPFCRPLQAFELPR